MTIEKEAIEILRNCLEPIKASENDQREYASLATSGEALHRANAALLAALRAQIEVVLAKIDEEEKEQKELQPYRCTAMAQQKDGEIEVDAGAIVSLSDSGGAYVQAWFWVDEYDVFDDDPCEICKNTHNPLDFGLTWCGECSELAEEATAEKRGDGHVCAKCLELESALKARGER